MRKTGAFLLFLLMLTVFPAVSAETTATTDMLTETTTQTESAASDTTTTTDTTTTADTTTTTTVAPSEKPGKTLSVQWIGNGGRIVADTQKYMFWEYPLLSAGGRHTPGTLTIRNDTEKTIHVYLDSITLPYQSQDALDYLAALQLTVRENGEILYQGPYTGVNDEGGLRTDYTLEPGQARVWEIEMYCPFTYPNDPQQVSEPCIWNFRATAMSRQTGTSFVDDKEREEQVRVMLIGAGLVLIGCVVAAVWYYRRSRSA